MRAAARWILALALVLFVWNVWGYDLWAPDEPYFAEGAREMIADGRWLIPHVNGVVTLDKPPLIFWLIAVLSWPWGVVSSLTARLPSAIAAAGSVALTMHLGRRLAGPRTGLWAGVILATSQLFWDKARTAQTESLLCFFVLAGICAFELLRAKAMKATPALLMVWAAAGLGALLKGPVALILVGVALATAALDADWPLLRRLAASPFLEGLVFLGVVGLWAVPALLRGGEYSLIEALRTHFVDRTLHGLHHKNPPWYYLQVVPLLFLPWSGVLVGALVWAWRRRRDPGYRLLLTWAAFVVIVFTLSGERRNLYVLPAFPAFALLVARFAGDALSWGESPCGGAGARPHQRWITIPQGIVGALFAVVGLAAPVIAPRFGVALTVPATAVGLTLAATGAALVVLAWRAQPERSLVASAVGMAVVYMTASTVLFPALNPQKSARELALAMREASAASRAAGETVVACQLGNLPEALSYFAHVYTRETDSPVALAEHLSRPREVYAVARTECVAELPPAVRESLSILRRDRLNSRDILLVVNRPSDPPHP